MSKVTDIIGLIFVVIFIAWLLLCTSILLIFLPSRWVYSKKHIEEYGERKGIINKLKHNWDFMYG